MSDNGPQFSAAEFAEFEDEWGFIHLTSSTGYPKSNGRAEAAVKAAKTMIKKSVKENKDQYAALLELRNTPVQSHGKSPSQMFFCRRTRGMLPTTKQMFKPTTPPDIRQKRAARNRSIKTYYDKSARDMPRLRQGEAVRVYPINGGRTWEPGRVHDVLNDRSYHIRSDENGTIYRRNRVHIRPVVEPEEDIPQEIEPSEQPAAVEPEATMAESRTRRERHAPLWMKDYVSK